MRPSVIILLFIACGGTALAAEPRGAKNKTPAPLLSSELSGADMDFLETAADSQAAQLALGELVKTRAQEPEIRTIATALYEDGIKERAALAQLAGAKGLPMPSTPATLAASKQLKKSLGSLKGPKFDKTALDLMSRLEGERAATLELGASSQDAQIREFAKAHYPAVQESLLLLAKLTGTAPRTVTAPPAPSLAKPAPR